MDSPLALLNSCKSASSSQVKDVIIVVVIHTSWYLWISRNHARFQKGTFQMHHILKDLKLLLLKYNYEVKSHID